MTRGKQKIFQHLVNVHLTRKEIEEISKRQKKSEDEVKRDIVHAINDLKYSQKEICSTIKKNNYKFFTNEGIHIGDYGKNNEFNDYFLCHDEAYLYSRYLPKEIALVTGFGPTNSPTAGTLSIIFRLLEIQKKARIYCHVIVSDLGALNSRKKPLRDLMITAERFKNFIGKLGFNFNRGEIRTHNSFDALKTSAITSSLLSASDFEESKEATEKMYKRLDLSGNDFSTMVDKNFTVGDILLPIIRDKKKLVLVVAGLEEHYYPRLSRVILQRMKQKSGGIDELVKHEPSVCAMYGRIIEGLFPYVKMSKSIPESSINIGNSYEEIKRKIFDCGKRNEHVILQMIELASDWDAGKIEYAKRCFSKRKRNNSEWLKLKEEYFNFFIKIKKIWDSTKCSLPKNIRECIF